MKKTLIILFIAVGLIGAAGSLYCCASAFVNGQLKGSGQIATRTVDLAPFNEIKASRAVEVLLVADSTTQALIEADSDVIDHVVVRVTGGELIVSINPIIRSLAHCHVKVTVPTNGKLRELTASSAASISSGLLLTGEELELEASSAAAIDIKANVMKCSADASSAASITAQVQAANFSAEASSAATIKAEVLGGHVDAEASSAATIQLSGTTDLLEADSHSASNIKAHKLTATNCDVEASSGSKIKTTCTGLLKASASSGASIYYAGSCRTDIHTSSGGSIRKL